MHLDSTRKIQLTVAVLATLAAIVAFMRLSNSPLAEPSVSKPAEKDQDSFRVMPSPSMRRVASLLEEGGEHLPVVPLSLVFPRGTIGDELVLTFGGQKALHAFLKRAGEAGIRLYDILNELNAVRIRASDLDLVDSGDAMIDFNYLVSMPVIPEPRAPDGTEYAAFGSDAIQWLGGADAVAEWGRGVKIALLDTGVDPRSPVAGRLAGVIDVTGGANLTGTGHATAIATLLLGEEGRVTGIAPEAELISVQVVGEDGYGDSFSLAKGMIAAVDQGAKVLSISLGSFGDSNVVRNAVEYTQSQGAVVVAAAGNEGVDAIVYPARSDGVIGVTAADANGQVPYFGNRGAEVDIAAPGVGVVTRWDAESGISFTGTSAAVPFVSGTIAGLLSEEPYRSAAEIAQVVKDYSNDAGAPGIDSTYGAGVLNIYRLTRRGQSGIYDLAIADYYVDNAHATSAGIPVVISAENRGTEPLFNILMQANVGGVSSKQMIGSLGVGQTGSYTVLVPSGRETQVTASAESLVTGTVAVPETRTVVPVTVSSGLDSAGEGEN
jgi:hypothetical protein